MNKDAQRYFERAETLRFTAINYFANKGEQARALNRRAREFEARAYAILADEFGDN